MIVVSAVRLFIVTVEANAEGDNRFTSPNQVKNVDLFGATYASIPVILVPYV